MFNKKNEFLTVEHHEISIPTLDPSELPLIKVGQFQQLLGYYVQVWIKPCNHTVYYSGPAWRIPPDMYNLNVRDIALRRIGEEEEYKHGSIALYVESLEKYDLIEQEREKKDIDDYYLKHQKDNEEKDTTDVLDESEPVDMSEVYSVLEVKDPVKLREIYDLHSEDKHYLKVLCTNDFTPANLLIEIYEKILDISLPFMVEKELIDLIASNKNIDSRLAHVLYRTESSPKKLASNPSTPKDLLLLLASKSDSYILERLLDNPSSDNSVLGIIALNGDDYISKMAFRRMEMNDRASEN